MKAQVGRHGNFDDSNKTLPRLFHHSNVSVLKWLPVKKCDHRPEEEKNPPPPAVRYRWRLTGRRATGD